MRSFGKEWSTDAGVSAHTNARTRAHRRVVKQISGLNGDRRCYRNINGVLVERTIATALPDVTLVMNKVRREAARRSIGRVPTSASTRAACADWRAAERDHQNSRRQVARAQNVHERQQHSLHDGRKCGRGARSGGGGEVEDDDALQGFYRLPLGLF